MIQIICGIVIRAEDLAEHDKRLILYTKELGKIKANIIGVKKVVSKLRSLTIPFNESRFQIYLHGTKRAGAREPGKIISGEILVNHSILKEDWDRMIQTSAVCEILDFMTHSFYPNLPEYQLLTSTLNQMETTPNPVLLRCRFALSLLKILGYSMRHHSYWNSFSDNERNLLNQLARWNTQEEMFSKESLNCIERITNNYLNTYLPHPLKTEIFRQKMKALETVSKNLELCVS